MCKKNMLEMQARFKKLSQRSLEVALLAPLPANLTEKHSREQPDMPGDEIKPELII
jgi:hypothetical protein